VFPFAFLGGTFVSIAGMSRRGIGGYNPPSASVRIGRVRVTREWAFCVLNAARGP
jgi:hypothetical protein